MKDEVFFDTNIIAYAFDKSEPRKKKICERLVERVFKGEIRGCVSNQVLGELFVVLTEKIGKPISRETARIIVEAFIESDKWKKIDYSSLTVKKALVNAERVKASFWDILIVETMKENKVSKIYTENEKDFRKIGGVEVINPFKSQV